MDLFSKFGGFMQTGRLFEIVYILSQKRTTTARELAEHFEVSTRTIYRDLDVLSGAGIPIFTDKGKGGGIRLMEGYVLDKGVITPEEKKILLSGLHAVAATKPDDNRNIIGKLESLLGQEDSNWIEIDFGNWRNNNQEKNNFNLLKNSILNKYVVNFDYSGLRGIMEERTVEPLKLIFRSTAWYLYGFCQKRQAFRFFKLMRIQNLTVSEIKFDRICNNSVLVDTNTYPSGPQIKVKLRFDSSVAYRCYDELTDYTTLENGDVEVEVEIDIINKDFLYNYILSFGDNVEVLSPDSIRKDILDIIHRICKRYQK